MKAAFKKIIKEDHGGEKPEAASKNESVLLQFYIPDLDWRKPVLCCKKDTVGEILVRVLNMIDEPLSEVDQYRIYKPSSEKDGYGVGVPSGDRGSVPATAIVSKDGKFMKNHRVLADSHLKGNTTLLLLKDPKVNVLKEQKPTYKKADKSKTTDVHTENQVFGVDLAIGAKVNNANSIVPYPLFIEKALQYLEKEGVCEGIFRLSGMSSEIASYKDRLDRGINVGFESEENPHNIAGLVKLYLRELPEPLMTWDMYEPFIVPQQYYDADRRIDFYRGLVSCLPEINRSLLCRLCKFFNEIAKHAELTKMHFENLATVLGPNIFKRKEETMFDIVAGTGPVNSATFDLLSASKDIFSDPEQQSICVCARALHDYEPAQDGEVALNTDDIVYVTDDSMTNEGWWEGFNRGLYGFIPKNYVEIICEVAVSAKPKLNRAEDSNGSAHVSSGSINQPPPIPPYQPKYDTKQGTHEKLSSSLPSALQPERSETNVQSGTQSDGNEIDKETLQQAAESTINSTTTVETTDHTSRVLHVESPSTEKTSNVLISSPPTPDSDLQNEEGNIGNEGNASVVLPALEILVPSEHDQASIEAGGSRNEEGLFGSTMNRQDSSVRRDDTLHESTAHVRSPCTTGVETDSQISKGIPKSGTAKLPLSLPAEKSRVSTATIYHDAQTGEESQADISEIIVEGAVPVTVAGSDEQVSEEANMIAPFLAQKVSVIGRDSSAPSSPTENAHNELGSVNTSPVVVPTVLETAIDDMDENELREYIMKIRDERKRDESRITAMDQNINNMKVEIADMEMKNADLHAQLAERLDPEDGKQHQGE
eukprot:CFRG5409T1